MDKIKLTLVGSKTFPDTYRNKKYQCKKYPAVRNVSFQNTEQNLNFALTLAKYVSGDDISEYERNNNDFAKYPNRVIQLDSNGNNIGSVPSMINILNALKKFNMNLFVKTSAGNINVDTIDRVSVYSPGKGGYDTIYEKRNGGSLLGMGYYVN